MVNTVICTSSKRYNLTTCQDSRICIKLHNIHLAHMACQSTCRHARRHIPYEDRTISSRRCKLCIVMTPTQYTVLFVNSNRGQETTDGTDTDMERTSYPWASNFLISVPRSGFQRRIERSCPPLKTYFAVPLAYRTTWTGPR